MEEDFDLPKGAVEVDNNDSPKAEVEETKEEVSEETKDETKETETEEVEETKEESKEEETKDEDKESKEEEVETKEEETKETEDEDSSLNSTNISELTEGAYETPEELYEEFKRVNTKVTGKTVLESLNDQIEEKFGEGYTLSDVVEYQNLDFDNMSPFELLEHSLNLEDPEITDREIEAELREFNLLKKSEAEIAEMIENEELTKNEYDSLEDKFLRKVRLAKKPLKEYQSTINIEDLEIHSPNQPEIKPTKTPEEVKADSDRYEAIINDFKGVKIEVGTKEDPYEVNLEASDDDRNGIKEFLAGDEKGRNWIEKRWIGDEGVVDMAKLREDAWKIENHDRNVKIAFTQGKSAGVKKEVKDINNIDFEKGKNPSKSKGEGRSIAAKIIDEIN